MSSRDEWHDQKPKLKPPKLLATSPHNIPPASQTPSSSSCSSILHNPSPVSDAKPNQLGRLEQETEGNEGATGAGFEGEEGDEGTILLLEQTLKVSMAPRFDISRVMTLAGPRGA